MRNANLRRLSLLLSLLFALPLIAGQAQQSPSAFTVEDMLAVINVNSADLSDDGRWLAATSATLRDRLGIDNARFGDPTYVAPALSDVWIIETQTGQMKRLFADKRQVRGLKWSPDGARLALLELRNDAFVPMLWERAANKWQAVVLPVGKAVAENTELSWTPDGAQLLLTVRPIEWRQQARAKFEALTKVAVVVQSSKEPFLAWDDLRRTAADFARQRLTGEWLDYDEVYAGNSAWRILPAADHPEESARCLVTGTGLTHTASAKNRNAMHAQSDNLTDSMKMFQWGIAGGRPAEGAIGVAPEWFYKGSGEVLRGHGEPLNVPPYAEDGGEEPEVAGVYVIGTDGQPYRIGFAVGNEFSDHQFEKRNYLYLAGSKLRNCAIGPELVVDHEFQSVPGTVTVERDGHTLWSHEIKTGDAEMCHSLRNIEHHHFKFEGHRRPGDLHVHFFGADAFSFGAGVKLNDGDVMQVRFEDFGRALRNPVQLSQAADAVVSVTPLD